METKKKIKCELQTLVDEGNQLANAPKDSSTIAVFGMQYQNWYTRAASIVAGLASDRAEEFRSYYLASPKRKSTDVETYVIQDYIRGLDAPHDVFKTPQFDRYLITNIRVLNQIQILSSLSSRIEGVLSDIKGHLLADLEDRELRVAADLRKVNLRAAGAIAGVVLERHLQRVATNHAIKITKKNPTIADLNDPLKEANVYDIPTWRKIQYFADIRNLCAHSKTAEPTAEQVAELLTGVNSLVKTLF